MFRVVPSRDRPCLGTVSVTISNPTDHKAQVQVTSELDFALTVRLTFVDHAHDRDGFYQVYSALGVDANGATYSALQYDKTLPRAVENV